MKRKGKIVLSIFAFVIFLFISINLSIMLAGIGQVFCYFGGCSGTVRVVTLSSATLYHGVSATPSSGSSASLLISLNNPGSSTYITSLELTDANLTTVATWYNRTQSQTVINDINGTLIAYVPGSGTNLTFTQWDNNTQLSRSGNLVDFGSSHPSGNVLLSGQVTSFTFYPENSSPLLIAKGQVFYYVINFHNGQSVSGSLIAE